MNVDLTARMIANAHAAADHAARYDALWQAWDADFDTSVGYGRARTRFIDYVITHDVRSTRPPQMLDLGCGTGWLCAHLAAYGSVTGVDFAPATLERARALYGDYAHFIDADPNSPTLGLSDAFDLLVCSEVIEHVPDQAALIAQMRALLVTGGWLILTTPNRRVWSGYQHDQRANVWSQPHEHWLTPRELVDLLRAGEFTIRRRAGYADHGVLTPLHGFVSWRGWQKAARLLRIEQLYTRAILPFSLFQMIAARAV